MAESNEVIIAQWNEGEHYNIDDGVWYAGKIYKCLIAHTGQNPDTDNAVYWLQVSSGTTEKTWAFASSATTVGSIFTAGYYEYAATHNDFSPSVNFGSANNAYAAHPFIVTGAETSDELTIRVTGTSIDDEANRVESDTDDMVIPAGTAANSYFEAKKFLGQVAIEAVSGTAINCNYGWAKYWDNSNSDFTVTGLEAVWFSEANTNDSDVILRHHKATGWTYNAGAEPTPPTALAQMSTDHSTERNTVNGQPGAWKRTNLSQRVLGADNEGILLEVVAGAGKAFTTGNFILSITH